MPEPQQILPRSTPIIDVVFASTKPQYSLLGFFLCKICCSPRFSAAFSARLLIISPSLTSLEQTIISDFSLSPAAGQPGKPA
ncbi:hypothetical protein F3I58_06620 [Pantoea sp. VH_4]|uniref:Uncharacterized protein n=1 Tax=Candidatus Pantoea gossypiicola TaxID=2608008 RepID=A0AB34CKK4_9GAMM|nr:hypothetical protein F3I59_09295 [Pantoea sp. VH_8]KAA5935970.1 hypothetical protein F3I58_06620 [Pantoea sp. VH_4]KAA5986978.1 hypothetical protein F3I49_09240 [Pantoea sp. M_4]KAA6126083.1 hypothetical protein F3I20_09085 [Pantoea gossypiicola]